MHIGFIGAGNMGSAIIRGAVKSGMVKPESISIYDPDSTKTAALKKETGIGVAQNSLEVAAQSDIIILAVKPNMVKSVLETIKSGFDVSKVLVTVAVGIPIKFYKDILGNDRKIIRTMPNTPALVGEGMTLMSYDANVTEAEANTVKGLLECVGKVDRLDEKLMSEVTALTGSSPAYVYMFIEAMADAAVLSGIPRGTAYKLAAQAVLGSAKMVLETGKHPGELKDEVCSPGGTTIEAVSALEKNKFRYAVIEAMNECTRKAREISRQFEK